VFRIIANTKVVAVVRCLSTLHWTRLEVLDSAIDMWCG